MPFFLWSKTSSSNAAADPTINYAEGQAPSSLNDSARAMMARLSEYRDDIAGSIVTSGSSSAYALVTNEVFDTLAHMAGQMVAFVPHTTSGAVVTLNVDGLGAKPLRSAPGVELPAGVLVQGTPYVATYNNTDGAFYLHGFYGSPYAIPIGGMLPFVGPTPPSSSFVLPFGQAISRTTYATLFAMVGTTFGAGDGSTTFNVIDLRGRLPVPQDNMGGAAAGRVTSGSSGIDGTTMGAAGGEQAHTLSTGEMPAHTHNNTLSDPGHSHMYNSPTAPSAGAPGGGVSPQANNTSTNTTGITITNASAGGGGAHNNMPPSIVVPWILRVI